MKKELSEDERKKELKALLYRKGYMEHQLSIYNKNALVADKLCKAIEDEIKNCDGLKRYRMEYELISIDQDRKNWIQSFKHTNDLYVNWLPGEIEQVSKEAEREGIEFKNIQKEVDELVELEIWGKVQTRSDEVELPDIIEDIKDYLAKIDKYASSIVLRLPQIRNEYEKARLEYDLCNLRTHEITLTKRLNKRIEYYEDVFLPKFREDMKRKKQRFEMYLKNANEIAKLGIDVELPMMLSEREKHKDDDEHEWLFFIALENRLKGIAKTMRRNKSKFKKHMHLAKKELYQA